MQEVTGKVRAETAIDRMDHGDVVSIYSLTGCLAAYESQALRERDKRVV